MVTRSSTTFRTLQLSCVVSWLPYMFVVAPPPPLTKRSLLHETHRENQNAKAPLSAHHPRASMELIKCEWWPDPSCSCIPDVVSPAQHLLPHFDQPVISFCSSAWELILFFFILLSATKELSTQTPSYYSLIPSGRGIDWSLEKWSLCSHDIYHLCSHPHGWSTNTASSC